MKTIEELKLENQKTENLINRIFYLSLTLVLCMIGAGLYLFFIL